MIIALIYNIITVIISIILILATRDRKSPFTTIFINCVNREIYVTMLLFFNFAVIRARIMQIFQISKITARYSASVSDEIILSNIYKQCFNFKGSARTHGIAKILISRFSSRSSSQRCYKQRYESIEIRARLFPRVENGRKKQYVSEESEKRLLSCARCDPV